MHDQETQSFRSDGKAGVAGIRSSDTESSVPRVWRQAKGGAREEKWLLNGACQESKGISIAGTVVHGNLNPPNSAV